MIDIKDESSSRDHREDQLRRADIQMISRHSNWSADRISSMLASHVYSGSHDWKRFLKTFLLSLGVSFTVSGIIFFFAFNWDDITDFTKIALLEGLVTVTTLAALLLRLSLVLRNVILTGAAMLVGVLFAVFGQIYQTGANAYDFFLAWTACIALWVAVSNFPPLWLIFIALVNITFILFVIQVGQFWEGIEIFVILLSINAVFLAGLLVCEHYIAGVRVPAWFRSTLGLAAAFYATTGMCMGINRAYHEFYFRSDSKIFAGMCLLTAVTYAAGLIYGFRKTTAFFVALVSFSLVVIFTCMMLNMSSSSAMYLVASMFVIGSVTGIVGWMIYLQKKWSE